MEMREKAVPAGRDGKWGNYAESGGESAPIVGRSFRMPVALSGAPDLLSDPEFFSGQDLFIDSGIEIMFF